MRFADLRTRVKVPLFGPKRYWGGQRGYWATRSSFNATLSLNLPHREWLAQVIDALPRVRLAEEPHLLEIGASYGPNLAAMRQVNLRWQVSGIDISQSAVDMGKRMWDHDPQVRLSVGDAGSKLRFKDETFDVVLSDACLLYVPPWKIQRAVKEMSRVSRNYIVLVELTSFGSLPMRPSRDGWLYDYRKLFGSTSHRILETQQIPINLRSGGRWPTFGRVMIAQRD